MCVCVRCVRVGGGGAAVAPGRPACRLARQSSGVLISSGTFGCHFKLFGFRCGHGEQQPQGFMSGYRGCDA